MGGTVHDSSTLYMGLCDEMLDDTSNLSEMVYYPLNLYNTHNHESNKYYHAYHL